MAQVQPPKFRAFISYSHSDQAIVKWLHQRLEDYPIARELVGRPTPNGPVPATLRPVFRDRDDFSAGHSLSDQTRAALESSAALIVVCSPAAAVSHFVNEEVLLFKQAHPDRPVVPLIVAGRDGMDPAAECFPSALAFVVSPV